MNRHHVFLQLDDNRIVAVGKPEDRSEEIRAAYQRITELEYALKIARNQVLTLGGDPRGFEGGDTIQVAILNEIDGALCGDVR